METRVKNEYIRRGYIAARSAGSKSPYDVYAVQTTGEAIKHVDTVRGVEYVTYVTPVVGFAIQCKRREVKYDRVPRQRRRAAKTLSMLLPIHSDPTTS